MTRVVYAVLAVIMSRLDAVPAVIIDDRAWRDSQDKIVNVIHIYMRLIHTTVTYTNSEYMPLVRVTSAVSII